MISAGYLKYINNHYAESTFSKNIQNKKYNPTPFCIPHVNSLVKQNNKVLKKLLHQKFNKWYKLPKSAYKLYWKFHLITWTEDQIFND